MGYIRDALKKLDNLNESLLKEDLEHWAKKNYRDIFGEISDEEFIKRIISIFKIDPTAPQNKSDEELLTVQQGAYTPWILKLLTKGLTYEKLMDDYQLYVDTLKEFNDLKRRNRIPSDKKDINKFKSIDEIKDVLDAIKGESKATEEEVDDGSFKYAVKNIRKAISVICKFEPTDIPSDIQTTEDCLTLLGEDNKWEIWQINSIWGAMLADCWGIPQGGGATWCTGGQYSRRDGTWRWGQELLDSASTHYNTYANDSHLVFIQQKDLSVKRPDNKYQIGFDLDYIHTKHDFDNADDRPVNVTVAGEINNSNNGDNAYGTTAEKFAAFINQENLNEVLQNSVLKNCKPLELANSAKEVLNSGEYIINITNTNESGEVVNIPVYIKSKIKVLKLVSPNGEEQVVDTTQYPGILAYDNTNDMYNFIRLAIKKEPFEYRGGEINSSFKSMINIMQFNDLNGNKIEVNAKEYPEFLECDSIDMMIELYALTQGEPFVYIGGSIPSIYKELITEIELPDDYDYRVYWSWDGASYIGIPVKAFEGCINLKQCTFPSSVIVLGTGCFRVNGPSEPYTDIKLYTPRHKVKCSKNDEEWLRTHLTFR